MTNEIRLEDLTPSVLAATGNRNCAGCRDLMILGQEVIDALPPKENIDPIVIVGRFAGFSALCPRGIPVPPPNCDSGLCSVIPQERGCKFSELLEMSPEERMKKVQELSDV